ncbi:MAG: hypothetical protein BYD32DRAFT_420784 [Podila humilis]|nr:MAG: hypothetical protein BYD32DRAFT_420784 [Podila humilis]
MEWITLFQGQIWAIWTYWCPRFSPLVQKAPKEWIMSVSEHRDNIVWINSTKDTTTLQANLKKHCPITILMGQEHMVFKCV